MSEGVEVAAKSQEQLKACWGELFAKSFPQHPLQKLLTIANTSTGSARPREASHSAARRDEFSEKNTWSRVQVEQCGDVSRLTVCKSIAPLRIVNPRSPGPACQVLISHFGGGMLDGDDVCLKVSCKQGTKLHIGSVGNLQVYRSLLKGSSQRIQGVLEENALAVFGPDPVVPHAGSIYRQAQEWQVHPDASLLIAEILAAGRVETGERFAFGEFASAVSVNRDDRPVLRDALVFKPSVTDYRDPAVFAGRCYCLSGYLIGPRWAYLADLMDTELRRRMSVSESTLLAAIHPVAQTGYLVRVVAETKRELIEIVDLMYGFLKEDEYLGFNPRERRY